MNILSRFCLAIAAVALCGCLQTSSSRVLSTRFAFPNSDLTPIGPVKNETTQFSVLFFPTMDKAAFDELTQGALKQDGGDTLVDYVLTTTVIYPILPIYYTKYDVEGTSVRVVEIGRQQFRSKM